MAYIGTWPSTITFATAQFEAVSNTRQTVSQSGRRIRVSTAGSRFAATLRYPNMALSDWLPIQAVATRCEGALNSFDITLPTISENSSGVAVIVATVNGTNAVGSSTVNISTNKNSQTIMKAGNVVKFPSHSKVYMLIQDATTDGSGDVTLNITPNLFEAVNDDGSSTVTVDDVPFRMTLANDVQQYRYATDGTVRYEIDVIEEI